MVRFSRNVWATRPDVSHNLGEYVCCPRIPTGGASLNYTQTGSKGGAQVNVPIPDTPFRASAGFSPGRFNLGASAFIPGTKDTVTAGVTLSFGYLGDATCR